MGEQIRINTICPTCDGDGEVRVARAIVSLKEDGSTPAHTAVVSETCKTCGGNGKLKGFQPPV